MFTSNIAPVYPTILALTDLYVSLPMFFENPFGVGLRYHVEIFRLMFQK